MEWKGFKRGMVGLALVVVILWTGNCFSQPGVVDNDESGQIKEALSIAGVPLAISGPLELTMLIDQSYCQTGGVQCTETGHTPVKAALKNNHNPVRVMIQVLDEHRSPVTGLTSAAFSIATPFVPAGGPGLARAVCADCFQEASPDGVYAIFVHPVVGAGNWKSGAYCLQVEVTAGTAGSNAVGLISIAF